MYQEERLNFAQSVYCLRKNGLKGSKDISIVTKKVPEPFLKITLFSLKVKLEWPAGIIDIVHFVVIIHLAISVHICINYNK